MKFSGKVQGWQWADEQILNFGGDPDHRLDTGIVFRFVTTGRYEKSLTDILIRQVVALVRCALAEVCTVPVLFSASSLYYVILTSCYLLYQ